MKKVIKKVVAKAPVKKTVAKKPMMKSGGVKKPLPKAKDGIIQQGPLSEEDTKLVNDKLVKMGFKDIPEGPYAIPDFYGAKNNMQNTYENNIRRKSTFNTNKSQDKIGQSIKDGKVVYKKGGAVKKAAAKKIMVKSKKK